ncbi:hypothetical protein CDIK_0825 [Cucumispora dikerogammari]|nr:hypothetical protein CDIK_0825 [Cucumispora dikerogammari]
METETNTAIDSTTDMKINIDADDAGTHLLRDLNTFKHFNFTQYNLLSTQTDLLVKQIKEIESKPNSELTFSISILYVILSKKVDRNNRILRNYVYHRNKYIIESVLSSKYIKRMYLSEKELHTRKEFLDMLNIYKEKLEISTIRLCSEEPPFSLFVDIAINEDAGIVIEKGEVIELKKGMCFHIKKELVRHLLSSGKITVI